MNMKSAALAAFGTLALAAFAPQAMAALLDMSESRLTSAEADQLATLIEKAKREGK